MRSSQLLKPSLWIAAAGSLICWQPDFVSGPCWRERGRRRVGIWCDLQNRVSGTVAILAQGTHWAVAVMQAFSLFVPGSKPGAAHISLSHPSLLLEFCAQKVFISLTYFGLPITSCEKQGSSRESQ